MDETSEQGISSGVRFRLRWSACANQARRAELQVRAATLHGCAANSG